MGPDDFGGGGNPGHRGDPCLVLTSDPKPRLRWTADLHDRFVDAVTQLGGASSESCILPIVFAVFSSAVRCFARRAGSGAGSSGLTCSTFSSLITLERFDFSGSAGTESV